LIWLDVKEVNAVVQRSADEEKRSLSGLIAVYS